MTIDPFTNIADSPISSAEVCFPIAPSDSADPAQANKAIYVGAEGDVVLKSLRVSADVTLVGVVAGRS